MYKYDGLIVHQSHDDDGILEVIEHNGVRSLHFGSSSLQSCFQPDAPDQLVLDYVRAMTAGLLFKTDLNEVLMIGLGGGSLARFILQHFPDCRITALESRCRVVEIARRHFDLPLDTRLTIIIEDGGHFCRRQSDDLQGYFSLLLIDAFDHDAMSSSLGSMAFFDACRNLLQPDGMLVINLWKSDKPLFETFVQWLHQAFDGRILLLPDERSDNVIVLAYNNFRGKYRLTKLRTRALNLESQYGIDFPGYLRALIKNNPDTLQRLIKK